MKIWFYPIGIFLIALAAISQYIIGSASIAIGLFVLGAIPIYLSNRSIWLKIGAIVMVPFISTWFLILVLMLL